MKDRQYLYCKKRKSWPRIPVEVCFNIECKHLLQVDKEQFGCTYKTGADKAREARHDTNG